MFEYLQEMVNVKIDLQRDYTVEERNMIGVGLRNYVGQLQTSVRVLSAINKTKAYSKYGDNLPRLKLKMQFKLKD